MSPMSLSTRLDKLEAAIRGHDGGPPDEPLIFWLHQWAKAEGCPRAFQPWQVDELSPRFQAIALDNLVAAGKIRECDRGQGEIYEAGFWPIPLSERAKMRYMRV
jgi:hypothetical protein